MIWYLNIESHRYLSTGILFAILTILAVSDVSATVDTDKFAATILVYHRFGESKYPSTNIRIDQFEKHIEELTSGPYNVMPLEQVIQSFIKKRQLPRNTVSITIDDAYRSIYTEAWPRLQKAKLPFTVFVATDPVDRKSKNFMTWDQIREIKDGIATIGHHTASHLHMVTASRETVKKEINEANKRYEAELGEIPKIFAYPFGEASLEIRKIIWKSGFIAALGQHSGVAHAGADIFYLPRFPLNEKYGTIDRLKLAANSLPLPVTDITPRDFVLRQNPPSFGFTVSPEIESIKNLKCFASPSNGEPTQLTKLGKKRVEVRVKAPFPPGRARFNCTLPANKESWRWFGMQFYVPKL